MPIRIDVPTLLDDLIDFLCSELPEYEVSGFRYDRYDFSKEAHLSFTLKEHNDEG